MVATLKIHRSADEGVPHDHVGRLIIQRDRGQLCPLPHLCLVVSLHVKFENKSSQESGRCVIAFQKLMFPFLPKKYVRRVTGTQKNGMVR